jgi:uncharacterized protein YecE (DUF72 family)
MRMPASDPGVEAAGERAALVPADAALARELPGGGTIRIGTAGWTDPTLTAPGVFYPPDAGSAEGRLRHYATRFSLVEVDSTYYALPTAEMARRWVERTPDGFVFDVKAHALLTGHPTDPRRLPRAIRAALPADLAARPRLHERELPAELLDEVWRHFAEALAPLSLAARLGAVLMQYPPWLRPSRASMDRILAARERLGGLPIAIELRHRDWFAPRVGERLFDVLGEHAITYVIVDEPQGHEQSVPPSVAVTSPELAVLRLHGRRADQWGRRGATVAEKYRYLYDRAELGSWIRPVLEIAMRARETHVVFNNCYGNYGTTNALEFGEMLLRAVYRTSDQ